MFILVSIIYLTYRMVMTKDSGQASAKIEVTPEMVEAGLKEPRDSYLVVHETITDGSVVRDVIRAALDVYSLRLQNL